MRRGRGLVIAGVLCSLAACGAEPRSTAPGTSAAAPTGPLQQTTSPSPGPTASTASGSPSPSATPLPSLVGDTRNAWAFAPLDAPDRVVVEGEVPRQRAWSTSKVLVVAAFLDGLGGDPERMSTDQRRAAIRSLTESDLESLRAVRGAIPGGAPAAMTRILRELGDTTTSPPPELEGTMIWSVREQVRFMAAVHAGEVVSPAASRFLLDHLQPVASQQWGLSGIGATAVKGGWLRADTETRQMGIVGGHAVAIITDGVGPAVRQDDGESAHVQQMDLLAARLARRLAG